MKTIALILFSVLLTTSVCLADFQTISDQGLNTADENVENIKQHLRDAKSFTEKVVSTRNAIDRDPSLYDTSTIQAEWDSVIAELRAGLFCRGCHRTKREYGPGFEAHAAQNGGTEPASQNDYDSANQRYSKRFQVAQEIYQAYDDADSRRRSNIMLAQSLITPLIQAYQLSYDFQLKAYGPIKKLAKDEFKKLSDLLSSQNERVLKTPPDDQDYKNNISNRFETTEKADTKIDELNKKRVSIIKQAEAKRQHFIETTQEIQEIASTLGNEIYLNPGAITTAASFNYEVALGEYIAVRAPEKLEKFFDSNIFSLYKKVKSEGK